MAVMFFTTAGANARVVELTLHPTKAAEPAQKYRLLPKPEEQSDSDASPLYKKAIESLPENNLMEKIIQWRRTPLDELPIKQVQSTLQELRPVMQLIEKAARCKQCQWSALEGVTPPMELLREFRKLADILAVQTRLQITEGRYEQAIDSMQIGLAMAKHLGEAPALVQGITGVAIGALMLNRVGDFVQRPDAPSFYWALRDLPKPLVDLTVEWEPRSIPKRVHMLMNRLDRHLTMLQCIEALRLYAGAHDGKFPNKLSEITQVTIPSDPVSKKPFIYRRSGSEAVLEGPSVKGIKPEDMISYKLILKE